MFKVQGGQFIDSTVVQGAGMDGQPEAQITIQGNWELINMQTDIMELKNKIIAMEAKEMDEARIRDLNPALKDLHDQYKVVYKLVKTADDNIQGNDGGG